MDKAAPLGHVVDHVKEQRQRAKEASKISSGVPSEIDESRIFPLLLSLAKCGRDIVDQIEDGSEQIKSSICCDDRPELFAEIGSALKALEATIVEANFTKHTHQHPHNP
ncbi:putative transcription factor bHLH107 [Salvia splendens]|uniref:putative transcription factor bHLH107 n=1 Tax=Salvia splendens TaxID=180675 RepID=UPI001C27A606|nr:putative transcription factor bHLH107 [Salvia splendens]